MYDKPDGYNFTVGMLKHKDGERNSHVTVFFTDEISFLCQGK